MIDDEIKLVRELADAYRILREAYHHDIHGEEPATTPLQVRVREMLDKHASAGTVAKPKADFVFYRTQLGYLMRARVDARHKNGDITVEPWFKQKNGQDTGMFQGGHKIRVTLRDLVKV